MEQYSVTQEILSKIEAMEETIKRMLTILNNKDEQ